MEKKRKPQTTNHIQLNSPFSHQETSKSASLLSPTTSKSEIKRQSMEFFNKHKAVRLQSYHNKYLVADDDEETVRQSRNGSSVKARWFVEFVEGDCHLIRLKSCYGKYLTASNKPFRLGLIGYKVLQTIPSPENDSSIEWEPRTEGVHVKLRTRSGNFLRANGSTPPWSNSVTHGIPHRTSTQDWVLWSVNAMDILDSDALSECTSIASSFSLSGEDFLGSDISSSSMVSANFGRSHGIELRPQPPNLPPFEVAQSDPSSPTSIALTSPKLSRLEPDNSFVCSPVKSEGRVIYYNVVDENGNVDEAIEENSFHFKGSGVAELKEKLEEETGLNDIIMCSQNPLNGKLSPVRLHLPPNNATIHVVVIPSSSKD